MKPGGSSCGKRAGLVLAVAVACLLRAATGSGAVASRAIRLPPGRDAFFIENDLVYRRFLQLGRDGAYRQINQDRTTCDEVDQGTWDQAADGTVRLHSTHHALRFRALLAGPLSLVLDAPGKIDALPRLAAAIRQFLAATEDRVFQARATTGFDAPPAAVVIRPGVETYGRDDVQSLLRQVEDTAASERTGVYPLTPWKVAGVPLLLILQDAVFQAADLGRVRRDHPAGPDAPPPFFFAQVDARTFAREVGSWQTFRFLGAPD